MGNSVCTVAGLRLKIKGRIAEGVMLVAGNDARHVADTADPPRETIAGASPAPSTLTPVLCGCAPPPTAPMVAPGGFSEVYLAREQTTRQLLTLKRMRIDNANTDMLALAKAEVDVMVRGVRAAWCIPAPRAQA